MDRTTLADELRAARFRTTQFRSGYDQRSVDDAIDRVVGQLVAGAADHEIVAAVEASRFPTTTARQGYEMADVDALLARVTTTLGGTPTTTSTNASSTDLPSALIEPPRGFLARLLGR